jgi:hypothetical protein
MRTGSSLLLESEPEPPAGPEFMVSTCRLDGFELLEEQRLLPASDFAGCVAPRPAASTWR